MFHAAVAVLIGLHLIVRQPAPVEPGLAVERLYHGVERPVMVEVRAPDALGALELALLDHEGALLVEPVGVLRGRVDLDRLMPDIRRIRRACYLQLVAEGEAVGSALVLQPMLSRLVPVEQLAVNPNGITYTKIAGWISETDRSALLSKPGEENASEDEAVKRAIAENLITSGPTLLDERIPDPRVFTGWRIYPERDVVMHTSHGAMRFALRPDHAPNTAWNFLQLCRGGFYDRVIFHRIVPLTRTGDPFVIQAGDPGGTGDGGPGYWLPMEPSRLAHDYGVISMARDVPPDSAGSQFFICLSRSGTARLDGHYCAFGSAVEGAETIDRIAETPLADVSAGQPDEPPVITATNLVPAPPRTPGAGRPDAPVTPRAAEPEEKPSTPQRVPR